MPSKEPAVDVRYALPFGIIAAMLAALGWGLYAAIVRYIDKVAACSDKLADARMLRLDNKVDALVDYAARTKTTRTADVRPAVSKPDPDTMSAWMKVADLEAKLAALGDPKPAIDPDSRTAGVGTSYAARRYGPATTEPVDKPALDMADPATAEAVEAAKTTAKPDPDDAAATSRAIRAGSRRTPPKPRHHGK